ncbi:MAG TPA: sulfatase [Clostridiales bacterium]|nr:sulfatase [Clostridiales bacterium]
MEYKNDKLNIVQIIWHDLGRHLSCYQEGSVSSPNLDRMAREGILFTNHYSTGPVCVPSRCSILTGRYPHAQELWRFSNKEVTLPKTLKEAGYSTYRFGFHEEKEFNTLNKDIDIELMGKELLGYEYTWKESRKPMDIADRFCEFLGNQLTDKPFFANVAFYHVHRPNIEEVDEETVNNTKLPAILPDLPDTYESKEDVAILEKKIKTADEAVGKILDCICSQGLKDKTLVYFTTDHGIDLPRAKMTVYDAGIQAALIFWGPDFIQAGKVDNNLHSHMDIFPTLMELINNPIPKRVQGSSFAPVFTGTDYTPREFVIVERTWEASDDPVRAIRTPKYKYIRNYCPGWPIPVPPDYTRKVGKEIIEKIYSNPRPFEELYDIENDPCELNNLANDENHKEVKDEMWRTLENILIEDSDPVLSISEYMSYLKELVPGRWVKEGKRFTFNI